MSSEEPKLPPDPIIEADIREASIRRLAGRTLGVAMGATAIWAIESVVSDELTDAPAEAVLTTGTVGVFAVFGVIGVALWRGGTAESKTIKINKKLAESENPTQAWMNLQRQELKDERERLAARRKTMTIPRHKRPQK